MEEENEFQKVKFNTEFNPYKGTLKLNLLEILEELDEDAKKSILSDGGWWNLISHQMAEDIVNEFSREHYNPEYTKLRELILNSKAMPELIRQWAISEIESREHAKEAEKYWYRAYWNLYSWIREYFKRNYSYENEPRLPQLSDREYGKDYSKELMKEVELKVQEWKKEFPDISIYNGSEEADRVIDNVMNDLEKL